MMKDYSTSEFASGAKVKPTSIHHSYHLHGHYLSVIPRKLSNGRLLWPKEDVDRVLSGGETHR